MSKKVFALAGVTAVAGLMVSMVAAGCSSTTTVTDPGIDGSTDSAIKDSQPKDTFVPDPETDAGGCPAAGVIAESDFGITFAPSGAAQSVCNQGDLDAIKAEFATGGGSATFVKLKAALSATCAPCVFTDVAATRWGMIVEQNGTAILDNSLAACFGVIGTPACAKSEFDIDTCLEIACPSECGDQGSTTAQACQQKALKAGAACGDFVAPFQTNCPTASDLADVCDNFVKIIEITCGGGPDAGLDASN